jgi:hypothetical protein
MVARSLSNASEEDASPSSNRVGRGRTPPRFSRAPKAPPKAATQGDSTVERRNNALFVDEAELKTLQSIAGMLQATFRDTQAKLPQAKPLLQLEHASIPEMLLTLPPKRRNPGDVAVHATTVEAPLLQYDVAVPAIFSPLEAASQPPPVEPAPAEPGKVGAQGVAATGRLESVGEQPAAPPRHGEAETSDACTPAAASTTSNSPNVGQRLGHLLGRVLPRFKQPENAEEEEIDAEFLKDMETPEATSATIKIQALFRRNKFLARKFLKSALPEPPTCPRYAGEGGAWSSCGREIRKPCGAHHRLWFARSNWDPCLVRSDFSTHPSAFFRSSELGAPPIQRRCGRRVPADTQGRGRAYTGITSSTRKHRMECQLLGWARCVAYFATRRLKSNPTALVRDSGHGGGE